MKKLIYLSILFIGFISCEKDAQNMNEADCLEKMKEIFKEELKCKNPEGGNASSSLYSGEYNGIKIYFVQTTCVNCFHEDSGIAYSCNMKKFKLDDFDDVKNHKKLFTGCEGLILN